MSDEPLYCTQCGAEDWACGHNDDHRGPYCDVCGVIPCNGLYCDQTKQPCEVEPGCPFDLQKSTLD